MALNDRERRREKKKKKRKNNVSQSFSLTRNKTQRSLLFRDGEPKTKEITNKKNKRDDDDDDDNVAIWRFSMSR